MMQKYINFLKFVHLYSFCNFLTGDLHKCFCGRTQKNHMQSDPTEFNHDMADWSPSRNTHELPTNAVGTLEFQGTGEGDKAQFIRVSDSTSTANIIRLVTKEWELDLPKLVITGIRQNRP